MRRGRGFVIIIAALLLRLPTAHAKRDRCPPPHCDHCPPPLQCPPCIPNQQTCAPICQAECGAAIATCTVQGRDINVNCGNQTINLTLVPDDDDACGVTIVRVPDARGCGGTVIREHCRRAKRGGHRGLLCVTRTFKPDPGDP